MPDEVVHVAAGGSHTCALTSVGGVWCWGRNTHGQLGDGSHVNRFLPIQVTGLSGGVQAIAAGESHTCALVDSGAMYCWGSNAKGQIGNGGEVDRAQPTAVSGLAQGVAVIAAGSEHTCAITTAGAVRCWGANASGQLGDDSSTLRRAPVQVQGLSVGAQAITAGARHSCAIVNGAAWCWGDNNRGELGDGSPLWHGYRSTPVAVSGLTGTVQTLSAGANFTCAITQDGAAWCWGDGHNGRLGNNAWDRRSLPEQVTGMATGTRMISAGGDHACALSDAGLALCWGSNARGQLGTTAANHVATPEHVVWR